jgi:hypothetical protein
LPANIGKQNVKLLMIWWLDKAELKILYLKPAIAESLTRENPGGLEAVTKSFILE